jgi:hypothetical protein
MHTPFFILMVICFATTTGIRAQEVAIKGGVNIAAVAAAGDQHPMVSFHLGVAGYKKISTTLGMRNELIFSRQGANALSDYKFRCTYLNMPVLLDIVVGKGLSIVTGPQTGLIISAVEKMGSDERTLTPILKTFDFAYVIGLRGNITNRFFLEGRYAAGITDIWRGTGTVRNKVFQVSVGYTVGVKQKQ